MSAQIEATLDALATKLTNDLPLKIDALNTESGDEYQLSYPVAVTLGVRDSQDYPRIYVLPEESEPESDHGGGGAILWRHRIRLVSFVAEWDEEALLRKLIRFQRAVREVALSRRDPNPTTASSSGGWRGGLIHERDEYGPVFSPEDSGGTQGMFVQGAASLVVVRQEQTIT